MSIRWVSAAAVGLVALAPAGAALAQPSPPNSVAAARAALTGPVARQWVFAQFDVFMGPGERCQQGDALRFLASGQVQVELCQGGQVTVRSVPWTLQSNGALDPILNFDGKSFLLIFDDHGTKHYMTLRQRGASQVDRTVDREYLLSGG